VSARKVHANDGFLIGAALRLQSLQSGRLPGITMFA
jgi:hypothetical protein